MSVSIAIRIPDRNEKLNDLRAAIQANQVTFPVPVPIFASEYRADVQWRVAELYFVHGWSPVRLAARYRISSSRVRQSLRSWARRARTVGYLQPILPSARDWAAQQDWPKAAMEPIVLNTYISSAFIASLAQPQQYV
jgi:hypothetical protein